MFADYWKVLVLNFSEVENTVFFETKVDGKMIFTDYWKALVLNFTEVGNMGVFLAKTSMERLYLLIIENFLF